MSESKVALVTGGASGLGRAAALLFAAKGCNVCIADVQDEKGHETCKAIKGKRVRLLVLTYHEACHTYRVQPMSRPSFKALTLL